jgi:hypothetical protein
MQYEFEENIDRSIHKAVRTALRAFKERRKLAQESGSQQMPPTYQEFTMVLDEIMESNKRNDMNRLRTPSLRELFERAWAQKLRNYATQKELRDAYEGLIRRY